MNYSETGFEITLEGPHAITLGPSAVLNKSFSVDVPPAAPPGFYRLTARIWSAGNEDFDEDEEIYEIVPGS